MALVGYSDSEDDAEPVIVAPAKKKRKFESELPPLPSAFRDLYSSTVRTSTHDDPSLHGGRKRVTPHVEGNWPTHIFLEWHPESEEYERLSGLIHKQQEESSGSGKAAPQFHSLLHNELGVAQPLHVSLSRPLVLKTDHREGFLDQLKKAISASGVRAFDCLPDALQWHPNETSTRWFLVLHLQKPQKDELGKLLGACNGVAKAFEQPLLYHEDDASRTSNALATGDEGHKFHVSIAWRLEKPGSAVAHKLPSGDNNPAMQNMSLTEQVEHFSVPFVEVKVRIGQDVTTLPLPVRRAKKTLFN